MSAKHHCTDIRFKTGSFGGEGIAVLSGAPAAWQGAGRPAVRLHAGGQLGLAQVRGAAAGPDRGAREWAGEYLEQACYFVGVTMSRRANRFLYFRMRNPQL